MKAPGIGLEIVSQFVLGGEGVASCWERETRELNVTRRREQTERIPALAPGVADTMAGVENQEANAAPGKMIADGEARLAASYDDGVDAFWIVLSLHDQSPPCFC
jgi:hypothetical protein